MPEPPELLLDIVQLPPELPLDPPEPLPLPLPLPLLPPTEPLPEPPLEPELLPVTTPPLDDEDDASGLGPPSPASRSSTDVRLPHAPARATATIGRR